MADVTAKLAEALGRLIDVSMVAVTDKDFATEQSVAIWNEAIEALRLYDAAKALRCQCGLKPASECEPWEPGCDLGQDPEHVRVHEEQALPTQADQGGWLKADIIRAAVAAMPHTNPEVADDLLHGHTMHTEADDVVAIFCAGLRLAAKEEAKPLKERADFIAGYDAGLIDGRACERRDQVKGQIRADFEARMKADGLSVARLDCGLYFSPNVGNKWEAEERKFAAPVAQAEPRKPVDIRAVFLAGRRSYATPCVPMNSDEEAWQEYMDDNGIKEQP